MLQLDYMHILFKEIHFDHTHLDKVLQRNRKNHDRTSDIMYARTSGREISKELHVHPYYEIGFDVTALDFYFQKSKPKYPLFLLHDRRLSVS